MSESDNIPAKERENSAADVRGTKRQSDTENVRHLLSGELRGFKVAGAPENCKNLTLKFVHFDRLMIAPLFPVISQ